MKSLYLFLFTLLYVSVHPVSAQKNKDFAGKITYENVYESNVSGMDNSMLATMMGANWDYYIDRNGAYQFEMNGAHMQKQFYDPSDFRLYTKFSNSDTLSWIDVREDVNEVISHELIKTDIFILGWKCNALILKTSRGTETYYFHRQLKTNPENFQKHKFLNMAYVLKHTQAIPLKIVLETEEMNFTSTAVEVEEIEFEEGFFNIPDLPSKPSTF